MTLKDRLKNIENNTPEIVEEFSFNDYIVDAISQKISTIPVWYEYDYSEQFELILSFLDSKLNTEFEDLELSETEKKAIAEEFLRNNNGFGILDKLLAKKNCSSVMVNSLGIVYLENKGRYEKTDLVLSNKQYSSIISRFKSTSPVLKVRENNFYITLITPPVADNMLIIKKIKDIYDTFSDLTQNGLISSELQKFMEYIIRTKKNIIISGQSDSHVNEFMKIIINSINETNQIAVIEDSLMYRPNMDNISSFSVTSLDDIEYQNILSTVADLNPDYIVSQIKDYKKFLSLYLNINDLTRGILTQISASSITDVTNRLVNMGMIALKSTEKQAKLKLASTFDYVIYLENLSKDSYRISSIMEITSTKSSSLVLNEVVRFVGDGYVLDFEEDYPYDEGLELDSLEQNALTNFRSRLR